MERLSEFKPLSKLGLPDLGEVDCSGLIVIVGPNSSGKSQLLRDIYQRIAGEPRNLVVATDIQIAKPDYEPFLACLEKEGYMERMVDENGQETFFPRVTYGGGEAAAAIQPNQSRQFYDTHLPDDKSALKRRSDFLSYYGRMLVTALFLERRLTSLTSTGIIDFEKQSPQHELHALYLNPYARNELMNEIKNSFLKAIWPDTSRGSTICVRVSGESNVPSAEDRLDPRKMSQYRSIETEGDGFKSYVATCVALLLSRRPVCLIDEPELCLHPPQAYNLGKFIGRFGSTEETVTFVSTHSSQILRGVIQSGEKMQIVRLTRSDDSFSAHLVSSEAIKQALRKPTVRAESVLDGIFSQAVVIVEADTDRTVYQATWESLSNEFNSDIHFSAVGGIGGIADTCALYKTLKIPVAVLCDLDLITNIPSFSQAVRSLVGDVEAEAYISHADQICNSLKNLPPTTSEYSVTEKITELAKRDLNWENGDDGEVRSVLQTIVQGLDRMSRLKRGGINALPEKIGQDLATLLDSVAKIGLFIVPVGELEEWLSGRGIKASRHKKWSWANEAAALLRSIPPEDGDIWKFTKSIGAYLFQSNIQQPATEPKK